MLMNQTNSDIESMALALFDIGAVRLGQFKLRSGKISPIYLDLRLLASYPAALRQATAVYRVILEKLTFDRLVGVPLAGLPIGTAVALDMDYPLIFPRPSAKKYGLGKMIEGKWEQGETAVLIDDLITKGGSLIQAADSLRQVGLRVSDAVVLVDRQQEGVQAMQEKGVTLHAGMTLSQLLITLENNKRITTEQRVAALEFI